jgi:hypothetical protein
MTIWKGVKRKNPEKHTVFEVLNYFEACSSREEGIRTLDMLPYTRFPSVRLQPLGHLSFYLRLQRTRKKMIKEN